MMRLWLKAFLSVVVCVGVLSTLHVALTMYAAARVQTYVDSDIAFHSYGTTESGFAVVFEEPGLFVRRKYWYIITDGRVMQQLFGTDMLLNMELAETADSE